LIVADGFYEWKPTPGARKQPFHISSTDQPLFAFAGLWSIWHAPDGGTLRSCAILTTAANETVAPLHDRMPVILAPGAEAAWLDPATPVAALAKLVAPLAPERTALRPVSTAVNDARYDGPECLSPPVPSEQATLFEV
jgi:putative SOS response-associated peptidase YedK